MKAIQYALSIPNYLAVRAADRLPLPILESGRIPGLSEVELPPKTLPGPEWLRLRPRLSGICGSDLSLLKNTGSPTLTPFISFPLVPGHEVVGDVTEIGAAVDDLAVGQRVVVCPTIGCELRGLVPCRSCAAGEPGLCLSQAEGKLAPGLLVGLCRDLPGGWAEEMVVHRSQVFPVPDALTDETAVLIEPFSGAVHAVLKAPPAPGSKVLIVGAGTIGLLVLAALRMLGHEQHITVLARYPTQERMAQRLGANAVIRGKGAGEAATQVTGAKRYKPIIGKPVYAGGFDWVFDCVGSARTVDESLRVAGPRGRVILVGCAAEVPRLDLSFVWWRELQVTGSYVYGREPSLDGCPHTFEVAMRLLTERPDVPLGELVTHAIPLTNWREAIRISLQRGDHGAIKVVFDCRSGA